MSTVVLLTALDLEFAAIRRFLKEARTRSHPAGTIFDVGQIADVPGTVCLGVTGDGNISAAVLAERAIAMFQPSALLCVGVAGGLKTDIALGDVVVATRIYALHSGREADDGFLARPRAWHASHGLEQLARQVARTGDWARLIHAPGGQATLNSGPPAVHFKPVASGEIVLTSRETSLTALLRDSYDDAAAIEMESAGIAHAAHMNKSLPALSVRGISDQADAFKHAADDAGWQYVAAEHAAAFSISLTTLILQSQLPRRTKIASPVSASQCSRPFRSSSGRNTPRP